MSDWIEREAPDAVRNALEAAGCPPLFARILAARGVTPGSLQRFLSPRIGDLPDPTELPGIREAADEILDALASRRHVVVFGDYDCDGISATAIVVRTLRALGGDAATVTPFLPKRLDEGYGMTDASVERMLREIPDVGLVVTVDNGINSVEHAALLRRRGIGVVITDHHLPGDTLPACTVVNPKVAAPEPFECLCGAGVAFLLAQRLMSVARERALYTGPNLGEPLVVLAGLATVTDLMPLTGPNRVFVVEALRRFTRPARVSPDEPMHGAPIGLKELLARAARPGEALTARDFGFALGPRINAAGRLSDGRAALDLLLVEPLPGGTGAADRERARELARTVDGFNVERKGIEQKMTELAKGQIVPGAKTQVIELPDGHIGVAGIVAAHVLEEIGEGIACVSVNGLGSARASSGYNARAALAECAEALARFGGHAAAAGYSVRAGELERFRALLAAACERQGRDGSCRARELIDAEANPEDLTLDFARKLRELEPFGEGNPEPKLVLRQVRFASVRPLGANERHLQLALAGQNPIRAVWWNHGADRSRFESATEPHDLLACVNVSSYGGEHVELRVIDIR